MKKHIFQVVNRQTEKWVFEGTISECEEYHAGSDMGDLEEILEYDESREQLIFNPIE